VILDRIFPRLCLHCQSPGHRLCPECLDLLELLPPTGRCLKCFRESQEALCRPCRKRPSIFHRRAALFEPEGPALDLISRFWKGSDLPLIDLLASFIALQLDRLKWEWPDVIAYDGGPFQKKNTVPALAKACGEILQRPTVRLKEDDFPRKVVLVIEPRGEIAIFPKRLYAMHLFLSTQDR